MTELYIEGHLMELGNIKIKQVYQINDVGEPKDRQLNYSFPFNTPETPNNVIALKMLGVIGNTSDIPYKQLRGKLVENGVEIIPDGVVAIYGKTKNGFKTYIYGGNVFLFDAIGSKRINELNLVSVNHEVTKDNFINSFDNTEGYIYALSDFGKIDPVSPTSIEINFQVPSIFAHTLWDLIFTQAGIEYYGDIFQSDKFKKLLLTTYRGYNSELDNLNTNNFEDTGTQQYVQMNQEYSHSNTLTDIITIYSFPKGNPVNYNFTIEITETKTYSFTAIITTITKNAKYINSYLDVRVNRSGLVWTQILKADENGANSYTVNAIFDLEAGDNLSIRQIFLYEKIYPIADFTDERTIDVSLISDDNLLLFSFNNFLGDLGQIAFVKDIMQHFGLIFQKRRNKLAYDFIRIADLIADRTNTQDWSDKLKGIPDENYKLSDYAQSSRFAYYYLEPDSVRFADGIMKVANETLPAEKTMVQKPYNAPTISDIQLLNNDITYTPFWIPKRDDLGNITEYKPFSSKNYLVEKKMINGTIAYGLTGASTANYTGDIPILDFSNLGYGQLLVENYTELNKVLDFNFIIPAIMLLNENDIQNLNYFKTIFLKQYAADFYINKIEYIDSSILSKVELVKIKR